MVGRGERARCAEGGGQKSDGYFDLCRPPFLNLRITRAGPKKWKCLWTTLGFSFAFSLKNVNVSP